MVRSLLLGKPGHKGDVRLRTKKPRALIPAFDLQFAFMSLSLKRCRGRMKSWLGQRDGEGRRLWACSLTSLCLVPTTFLSLCFSASWGERHLLSLLPRRSSLILLSSSCKRFGVRQKRKTAARRKNKTED